MAQSDYKFLHFTFRPDERSIEDHKTGNSIELCTQLYDLLLVFVLNSRYVFSHDELIRKAWTRPVSNSTLSGWIGKLRKILGDDAKKQHIILNVHGNGYKFLPKVTIVDAIDKAAVAVINQSEPATIHALHGYADYSIDQEIEEIQRRLITMDARVDLLEKKVDVLTSLIARQSIGWCIMLTAMSNEKRASVVLGLAEKASKRLIGAEQDIWIGTLESIDDHLSWTLDHYGNRSQELELAVNLSLFWWIQGQWLKGCQVLQSGISKHPETSHDLQSLALSWLGFLSCCRDDYENAKSIALKSRAISKKIANEEAYALSLYTLGAVAKAKGHYSQSELFFLECLKASQKTNMEWLSSLTMQRLGFNALEQTNYPHAEQWFLKSLAKMEELRNSYGVAQAQASLGLVTCAQGNTEQAKFWTDKSLESQNREILADSYFNLGMIEEASRRYRDAFDFYLKSLTLYQKVGDRRWTAKTLEAMARMKEVIGDDKEAARLYGSAFAIRKSISAPLSPAERKAYGANIEAARKRDFAEFQKGSERPFDIL